VVVLIARHQLAQSSRLVSWWARHGADTARGFCDGMACTLLPAAIVVVAITTIGV
jgi:hypothetical protein